MHCCDDHDMNIKIPEKIITRLALSELKLKFFLDFLDLDMKNNV